LFGLLLLSQKIYKRQAALCIENRTKRLIRSYSTSLQWQDPGTTSSWYTMDRG